MNRIGFLALIAALCSTHASAKTAPDYEGIWRTQPVAPLSTSNTKDSVTTRLQMKFSPTDILLQICPDSGRKGWNFAGLRPDGQVVGSARATVNTDGSITATMRQDPNSVRFLLRAKQNTLSGTMQILPSESLPGEIPPIPISLIKNGKC